MQKYQLSKIFTAAVFTASMLGLGGCKQGSPEDQRRYTIQNIKKHTIEWYFSNRCISILDAEKSSITVIMSYTEADLSKEDKESLMLNVQNSVYTNIKKIIGGKPMPGKNCLKENINGEDSLPETIQKSNTLTSRQKIDLKSMAGLKQ